MRRRRIQYQINVQNGEKRKSMIPKKSLRTEADAPTFDISAASDDKQQQKSNLIEVGIPSGGAEPWGHREVEEVEEEGVSVRIEPKVPRALTRLISNFSATKSEQNRSTPPLSRISTSWCWKRECSRQSDEETLPWHRKRRRRNRVSGEDHGDAFHIVSVTLWNDEFTPAHPLTMPASKISWRLSVDQSSANWIR